MAVVLLIFLAGLLTTSFALELAPNGRYICYVAKVSDGDTLHCRFPYPLSKRVKTYPVRLIGIDAPETGVNKKNTSKQAEEFEGILRRVYGIDDEVSRREVARLGSKATAFVEKLLQRVYAVVVETDVETRDRYGRVLGYVWLPDGRMLNEEIICNGYALPLTVPPNIKYRDRFLKCFKKALRERRGLWGELAD